MPSLGGTLATAADYRRSQQQNSGGGGMSSQQQQLLMRALMAAQRRANEENENRYQQAMQSFGQSRSAVSGIRGSQSQADIQADTNRQIAEGNQQMVSRGLSGTTVGQGNANMIRALGRDNQNRSAERISQMRAGMLTGLDAEMRGIMERRNDLGPDLGLLSSLMAFGNNSNSSGSVNPNGYPTLGIRANPFRLNIIRNPNTLRNSSNGPRPL